MLRILSVLLVALAAPAPAQERRPSHCIAVAEAPGRAAVHRASFGAPLPDAYADAGATMAANMMTEDAVEGIDAFIGKRDPKWTGR